MVSVSDILKDKWIDRAISQLDDEKSFGIMLSEFSRTVIDRPDTFAKIDSSYAGHAARLQITCVLRELRLWCCRIWDNDGHSLCQLAPRLVSSEQKIVAARRNAHPDWPEEQLGCETLPAKIEAFARAIEDISKSRIIRELKLTRNEHFAHLAQGVSGIRKELERSNPGGDGYSYNEVLTLADVSISLISEAVCIWQFRSHSDANSAESFKGVCERYWSMVPNFSELERTHTERRIRD